jgi:hypothetical protein
MKSQRKAANKASRIISRLSRQPLLTPEPEDGSDDGAPPSVSQVLQMNEFSVLRILDSEGVEREKILQGD